MSMTQAQLTTVINTSLPTNGANQITAANLRTVLNDMVAAIFGDSVVNSLTIGTGGLITSSGPGGVLGSNAFTSTAYLPLAGGTMVGNLLFTDNTYDIGAAAATRPRNIYVVSAVAANVFNAVTNFNITGKSVLSTPGADGTFLVTNNAGTDFSRLMLGGVTSSFPSLKRSSTGIEARLADDSAPSFFVADAFISSNNFQVKKSTADGRITLTNAAASNFDMLQFGGTSSGFPGLKRNGIVAEFKLADDSAFGEARALVWNIATTGKISWDSGSKIFNQSDGVIELTNNATTDFSLLQLGGTSASFPAIKRSTTSLQARLADDSAFTVLQGKLTTDTAYTAGAQVPSGYIVIYDSTGTAYKVSVNL